MLSKKVKSRFFLFLILIISLTLLILFIFKSLEKNIVYFLSPTEIYNQTNISSDKKIRVGGLVKKNSIIKDGDKINFIITDLKKEIIVSYSGIIPNLFSEEKGVVAEGKLKDKKYFIADTILAKHDENYMPPEVKKALDKTNY
jgi:cytochrome c-type biogenesis protein CcmE|tara:strand:- start:2323 stop:2751 length:429 start_codon:yes stop_codon:yes gene_type:complete